MRIMISEISFTNIIEAADQLVIEDQEDLIHILQNRLRDRRRAELIRDVREAQQEFALGQCQPVTPEELMAELLA
jgi:polyphosphate kinase